MASPPATESNASRDAGGPLLAVHGLSKRFHEGREERRVLDGVDLAVARGEAAVLFGRSGSGKTTLLNLVSGLERPDGGRVLIDGNDLFLLDETGRTRFRRARVGFVHQFFNLLPTLTVAENLRLPLELNGVAAETADLRVRTLLARVGLTGREASFPDRLSGGEQQRVAVARALIHGPDLVLADEPTGNLDDTSATAVLELLLEMTRDRGHALLMVSHSRETAARADAVYTLVAGRLQRGRVP